MKLLLVEDNIENAKLVIRILSTAGYEVTHKVAGLDGMAAARNENFDVILLDFDLPDIDGSQVGLALRKRLPKVPIIALTAHADRINRAKAKSFGFTAFIPKPFTDDELLQVLQTLSQSA
jgi:CheY-like chemotaxis protein